MLDPKALKAAARTLVERRWGDAALVVTADDIAEAETTITAYLNALGDSHDG